MYTGADSLLANTEARGLFLILILGGVLSGLCLLIVHTNMDQLRINLPALGLDTVYYDTNK